MANLGEKILNGDVNVFTMSDQEIIDGLYPGIIYQLTNEKLST